MNASIYRISLDIHEPHSSVCLDVKRGDTSRNILAMLTDGGSRYRISEECYAVFMARKPDGKIVTNDCSINGNTIIYEMTPQTTAAAGVAECEIQLYGAGGKLITSPSFLLMIHDTLYGEGDEIESSDEFNALASLIAEVQELKEKIGTGGLDSKQIAALNGMFAITQFHDDPTAAYAAYQNAFAATAEGNEPDEPDEPDEPEVEEPKRESIPFVQGQIMSEYFEESAGYVSPAYLGTSTANHNIRVSYVGYDIVPEAGKTYRLIGLDSNNGVNIQYGIQYLTPSGLTQAQAGGALATGTHKIDTGWKSNGYEFTATEDMACIWLCAHYVTNAKITPEEAMPVYLEEVV